MKNRFLTSLAAVVVVTLGMSSPADAAPAGPSSIDSAINQLQSQGYDVIVNRVGDGTADRCGISSVRRGQTYSRTDTGAPGAGDDLVTTVMGKTVYVELNC
jgi:hypothetical protein